MSTLRQPPSIEAYGVGGFRIGGARIEGSALILDDVARPWSALSLRALTLADFGAVLASGAGAVEFVLLGVGAAMAPPPRALREGLAAAGLGLEVTTTAEACRLYNILAVEGRRIAAALLAI